MTQGFRFGPGRCCCGEPNLSCEDPSRPICYVDKYATGAGDGTSWDDAYTSIISAISAKGSTHRIYIKGYGSSDRYTSTTSRPDSVSIHGYGDTWLSATWIGSNGCLTGLHFYGELMCRSNNSIESCTAGYISLGAVYYCDGNENLFSECVAENVSATFSSANVVGFNAVHGGCEFNDCIVSNLHHDQYTASYARIYGFLVGDSTLNDCVVDGLYAEAYTGTSAFGFGGSRNVLNNCVAKDINATGASSNLAYGFSLDASNTMNNCSCTSPEPANGCFA